MTPQASAPSISGHGRLLLFRRENSPHHTGGECFQETLPGQKSSEIGGIFLTARSSQLHCYLRLVGCPSFLDYDIDHQRNPLAQGVKDPDVILRTITVGFGGREQVCLLFFC